MSSLILQYTLVEERSTIKNYRFTLLLLLILKENTSGMLIHINSQIF